MKMVSVEEQAMEDAKRMIEQIKGEDVKRIPADDNFWLVKDIVTKYKMYPEGTEIYARPLKVIEIKKLASLSDSNVDFIINDILKKATRGLQVEDMYVADKIYLMLFLRANTFKDSSYVIKYMCPKCEKETSYHFGLDMLNINYLPDDYDPNAEFELMNKDTVSTRFLRVKDDIEAGRFRENSANLDIDEELLTMAGMINTINGESVPLHQKYLYLIDLEGESFIDLKSYMEKYSIGVDPVMNVVCSNCGGTSPMGITFHPAFFVPTRRFE